MVSDPGQSGCGALTCFTCPFSPKQPRAQDAQENRNLQRLLVLLLVVHPVPGCLRYLQHLRSYEQNTAYGGEDFPSYFVVPVTGVPARGFQQHREQYNRGE